MLCAQSLSHVQLITTPQTVTHLTPLSMEFSRQENCSSLLFPSPGDLPNPRTEPVPLASPALAGGFFTTAPSGKPPKIFLKYANTLIKF